MPTTRVSVRYTGRVQGVGFRATARAIASSFAVTGWVRNESDGSVTLEIQGKAAEVQRCLDAILHRMESRIRASAMTPLPLDGAEAGFDIRC